MKNIIRKRSGLNIIKKKPKSIPEDNFNVKFLENIVNEFNKKNEEKHQTRTILNWLSYYFQTMKGTTTALALVSNDNLIEETLWKKIIQPIFGYQYTITIDDEILKKDISEIVKEKVFYHIGDISKNDDNKNKLIQLLQAILLDKFILVNATKPKKIPVFGQVLITSEQAISLLKDFYTQFEYTKVLDKNEIITNLDVKSISSLHSKLTDKELDTFSSILSSFYDINKGAPVIINPNHTQDNKDVSEELDQDEKINMFVQAIKTKNLSYFEKVKDLEDGRFYNELKHAFFEMDDAYFIGQDLYHYYNAIYGKSFEKNKQLMDILKKKDDVFIQETQTLKILNADDIEVVLFQAPQSPIETGRKYLYKINKYKPATDINIPYGATIISSQTSIKYIFEDKDDCIKRTKECRAKKAKAKEIK